MIKSDAVTQEDSTTTKMESCGQIISLKISEVRFLYKVSDDGEWNLVMKCMNPHWREKLLSNCKVPVPQTDTGGRWENHKTDGITIVKELGKMTT